MEQSNVDSILKIFRVDISLVPFLLVQTAHLVWIGHLNTGCFSREKRAGRPSHLVLLDSAAKFHLQKKSKGKKEELKTLRKKDIDFWAVWGSRSSFNLHPHAHRSCQAEAEVSSLVSQPFLLSVEGAKEFRI